MINLKQEIQNFKWTHHKLDDNFGMTLEPLEKVISIKELQKIMDTAEELVNKLRGKI